MANSLLSFIKRGPTKGIGPVLRRSSLICLMVTALLISGFALPQAVSAKKKAANQHWVGTWSTSPVSENSQTFEDQTLRQIVHISIGGDWLRVRFSNRFGTVPLVIDAASIGVQDEEAAVVPGSLRVLTFAGDPSVTIAAGAKVLSDPVELTVDDEADLAVSLYVSENNTGGSTMHNLAWQTSYIFPGNQTDVEDMTDGSTTTSWFWLTGVEVLANRKTYAVVTFGDSITEGCCNSADTDTNTRYPDELARRLLARYHGKNRVAVLNAGISGNRVLNDSSGPNAQVRFDPDVLTQSGVTHVILLEGINDIGFTAFVPTQDVSADDIIAGYKQIIERVHAMGLKIFIGTLTPWKDNPFYYYPAGDDKRDAVNNWIRTGNAFDGMIDFDKAIRDPDNPEMMLPLYNSGDNLHPSAAGYKRMAEEVDLKKLLRKK